MNKGTKANHALSQQPETTNLLNNQNEGPMDDFGQDPQSLGHGMNPHYNNNELQNNNDPLNDVEFESGAEDGQQLNGQGNLDGGVFNQGSTSI